MTDDTRAELQARLALLSEGGLLRLLRQSAKAGQLQAQELLARELKRRGLRTEPVGRDAACRDYWHTVVGLRTPWCPTCGSSSEEVRPRTAQTRARKFRPRKERPEDPPEEESIVEGLLDMLNDPSHHGPF